MNVYKKMGKLLCLSRKFISTSNKILFQENEGLYEAERIQETSANAKPSLREKCVNEVTLIGRIGGDPQRFTSRKGNAFTKFRMATNAYTGTEILTDWHDIIVYGDDFANYIADKVAKGDRVYVKGKLEYYSLPTSATSSNEAESVPLVKKARIVSQNIIILKKKVEKTTYKDEF